MPQIHRAVVVDAHDPQGELKLKLRVPSVLGQREVWAWPLVAGLDRPTPPAGTDVWVWFEQGDTERPVWTGVLPPRRVAA